jgi:hypothetical protein
VLCGEGLALVLPPQGAPAGRHTDVSTGGTSGRSDGIMQPWWPHGRGLSSSPLLLSPISSATLLVPTQPRFAGTKTRPHAMWSPGILLVSLGTANAEGSASSMPAQAASLALLAAKRLRPVLAPGSVYPGSQRAPFRVHGPVHTPRTYGEGCRGTRYSSGAPFAMLSINTSTR